MATPGIRKGSYLDLKGNRARSESEAYEAAQMGFNNYADTPILLNNGGKTTWGEYIQTYNPAKAPEKIDLPDSILYPNAPPLWLKTKNAPPPTSASQAFAESFESVGLMVKGGVAVGAVNKQGQILLFSEDKNALTGATYEGFKTLEKGGFMERPQAKLIFDPYGENQPKGVQAYERLLTAKGLYESPWAGWPLTAEKFTLPSIETKSFLAEQKKAYESELSRIQESTKSAQAKGEELQLGVTGAQEESEELKALTASTREKLAQVALSETKLRAGIIDKSRGQMAARRGMTGGRESLYSLSERGFEQGADAFSARGLSSQRDRQRSLMAYTKPSGTVSKLAEGDFYRSEKPPATHEWSVFKTRPGYKEPKNTGSLYYWGFSGYTPEYASWTQLMTIPPNQYPGGETAYNAERSRLQTVLTEQQASGVYPTGFRFDPITGQIR